MRVVWGLAWKNTGSGVSDMLAGDLAGHFAAFCLERQTAAWTA